MTKGKKIIILVSMALVLIVASVLNVTLLADNAGNANGGADSIASFFESSRADRLATRNYEIEQLNSIINLEGDEYLDARANALAQKSAIVDAMETEMLLETLLMAQGFSDVLVNVSASTDNVNVIVDADELTRADTAKIYNIITTETAIAPDYVKIIAI